VVGAGYNRLSFKGGTHLRLHATSEKISYKEKKDNRKRKKKGQTVAQAAYLNNRKK